MIPYVRRTSGCRVTIPLMIPFSASDELTPAITAASCANRATCVAFAKSNWAKIILLMTENDSWVVIPCRFTASTCDWTAATLRLFTLASRSVTTLIVSVRAAYSAAPTVAALSAAA